MLRSGSALRCWQLLIGHGRKAERHDCGPLFTAALLEEALLWVYETHVGSGRQKLNLMLERVTLRVLLGYHAKKKSTHVVISRFNMRFSWFTYSCAEAVWSP